MPPRRTQMAMDKDAGKTPPKAGSREEKLAAALRANLRRRKVVPAAAKPAKPKP